MPDKFKNKVCKRFYEFFTEGIAKNEFTYEEIASGFGTSRQHVYTLFNNLKTGYQGVNVDHLIIAVDKFGMDAGKIFK